ncbi:MAG: DUF488 domain-containing protein [Parvularculaceae bacterium]
MTGSEGRGRRIKLKRIYLPPEESDGRRILVERLWPRGLTREAAAIDAWAKDVAPSPELRKWYAHDVSKWPAFQARYMDELRGNTEAVGELKKLCRRGAVSFLFAAKDEAHNSAVVLKAFLERAGL